MMILHMHFCIGSFLYLLVICALIVFFYLGPPPMTYTRQNIKIQEFKISCNLKQNILVFLLLFIESNPQVAT